MKRDGREFLAVAITGGLASGKSSLCRMLSDRGALVIDADEIGREVTRAGSDTLNRLVDRFGSDILLLSGELDRSALAKKAFSSRRNVKDLNLLTHPPILAAMRDKLEGLAASGYDGIVAVEAALIVEEGRSQSLLDVTVAVVCSDSVRRERVLKFRARDAAGMLKRSESQLPDGRKALAADYTVRNDGSLEDLESKANELWEWLLRKRGSR